MNGGDLQAGRRFGPYTVLRRLGSGGMAEVWLANATDARRQALHQVVLKTILPQYAANRDFVSMFAREAALAAQLNHPAIVQVYDLGILDERCFIEMEYVAGRTLRELLRRGRDASRPLALWTSLQIVADCCDGLMYAHEFRDHEARPLGLVHRDMSPENVMISFSGRTKIFDFGIATTKMSNLTNVGNFKGKLSYLPPETFEGAAPHRSRDIYAMGVLLYELATGTRPFKAPSEAELIYRITQGAFRPANELNPALPSPLVELISAMLARNPQDRPESAGAVAAELRALVPNAAPTALARADSLGTVMRSLFPEHASDDRPSANEDGADFGDDADPAQAERRPASFPPSWFGRAPVAEPRRPAGIFPSASSRDGEVRPARSAAPEWFSADPPGTTDLRAAAGEESSAGSRDLFSSVSGEPNSSAPKKLTTADLFPGSSNRPRASAGSTAEFFGATSGLPRRAGDTGLFSLYSKSSLVPPGSAEDEHGAPGFDGPRTTAPQPEREAARHFDRGFELLRAGDVPAALEAWDQARTLDPNNRAYDVNLKRLKRQLEENHGSR